MSDQVQWRYWNYDDGTPKGCSKTHVFDSTGSKTLCGINLVDSDGSLAYDIEEGDGSGGWCKKCAKKNVY